MSVEAPPSKRAAIADPEARKFLRKADPVLARLIDARPDFRPRAWLDELPPLDAFGTLIFQVAGQQLSVASTRAIVSHLRERFGGHLPSPAELLAADPQVLRDSGFSARKGQTLRALAERFVDGRLNEEALSRMSDDEVTLFRRRHIGLVFQAFNLMPTLTAAENIALPLMLEGRRPADVAAKVDELT